MPNRITVRATRSFDYEGRTVNEGDGVAMLPIDAAKHAMQHNVSLTREVRRYEMPAATAAPKRRRRARKTTAATA